MTTIEIPLNKLEEIKIFLGELHCIYDVMQIDRQREEALDWTFVWVKNKFNEAKMKNNPKRKDDH